MNFIYIDKLSFTYENQTTSLFDSISFQLQPGWTGVVGPNGSGKTTLLKLLTNSITPDSGKITFQGVPYYCEQRTDYPPDGWEEFNESTERNIFKLKNLLQIEDEWFARWNTLSHGERKRCQIAVALFHSPGLLAIDEPTNHLDSGSRDILINALQNFKEIGILVSHDREVLDRLCSHTLFISESGIEFYKCNFTTASEERQQINLTKQAEHDLIQREIKKMKRKLSQQRGKTEQAQKLKSKKAINPKDHDSKAKKDLARLTGKDAVEGQKYKRMQNQLDRKIQTKDAIHVSKSYDLGIQFNRQIHQRHFPLILKPDQIHLGGNTILSFSELMVQHEDKIGLIGKNGAGKSTFINYLLTHVSLEMEKILFIPQEVPIESAEKIISHTQNLNNDDKGKIMTIIRRLGSDPVHVLETKIPSPGEVRKLMLAHGLLQNPAIIVMDEPTNHMDLPSIECLEAALIECDCPQILVSHDHYFLNNIVDTFWEFESSRRDSYKISVRN